MKCLPVLLLFLVMHASSSGVITPTEIDKRLMALNGIGYDGHIAESLTRSQGILRDSRNISYSKGIAEACFNIAMAVIAQGNYRKAELYLKLAEKEVYVTNSIEFKERVNTLYAIIYADEKLYEEALKKLRKLNDYNMFKIINIGKCFSELNQSDSALIYLRKSFPLIKKLPEKAAKAMFCDAYCAIALEFNKKHQNDSARYYMDMGQNLAEETKSPLALYLAKEYLGRFYMQKMNADSAIISFKASLKLIQASKSPYAIKELYYNLYKAYQLNENLDKANHYLDLYESVSKSIKQGDNLSVILNSIKKDEDEKFDNIKNSFDIFLIGIGISIVIVGLLAYQKFKRHKTTIDDILKEKDDLLNSIMVPKDQTEIESIGLLNHLAKSKDPSFFDQFNELYPNFKRTLTDKHPNLSARDVEFCTYLKMNFDTKKIARLTDMSVRTIESKKYRLRKKLNISTMEDINLFISNI